MRCASIVWWYSTASDGRKRNVRSTPTANFSGTPSRANVTPKSAGATQNATGNPTATIAT